MTKFDADISTPVSGQSTRPIEANGWQEFDRNNMQFNRNK